jgi:Fic family protein
MSSIQPLATLDPARFETAAILRKVASANRRLGELKGIAASIPNQGILIQTLGLQEAKDSSAIENLVTTHDELFRNDLHAPVVTTSAAKEVLRYRPITSSKASTPSTMATEGRGASLTSCIWSRRNCSTYRCCT